MAGEVEVRREDQVLINEFGRGNAKLKEKQSDLSELKKLLEELEDATTELALIEDDEDAVKLMLGGESFIDVTEDYANDYCEREQERLQREADEMQATIDAISGRQQELKTILYARFGSDINLEER